MSATSTGMSVAMVLAALGQGTVAVAGQSAKVGTDTPAPTSHAASLREAALTWTDKVALSIEPAPHEVVIRFDRPLSDAAIRQFAADTQAFLADLRWNDDSLVMRPTVGNRIVVTQTGNGLLVRFVAEDMSDPDLAATRNADDGADDGSVELALAQSSADAAAGFPAQARQRLAALARAHPGDRQVARALADAEAAEGRTAEAAAGYLSLNADDPMARRIIGEAGGRAVAATIYRDGKTFSQWEASFDASVALADSLMAGVGARHVRTVVDSVSSAGGYLPRVHRNLTIVDATATLRPRAAIVVSLQAAALLEERVAGASARIVFGSPERQLRVFGAYRLPDYSTAEQAAFGGHISRIGAGGTLRLTPELVVQADAGLNGYGLAGTGVRTRTTQVQAGIDLLVMRRPLSMQIVYRLDAEYVDWTRRRGNGLAFIPLSNRENHTLQLVMSKPVRAMQMTVAAGWTKDRYGGNGPTASLGAVANLGDAWRLEASGGVSSISRPAISGRQLFLRLSVSRVLGRP
ncbi:MAG: hypothetical protein RIS94_945 [Pseudomonadota bacterium]|jgi:hypothetical protein